MKQLLISWTERSRADTETEVFALANGWGKARVEEAIETIEATPTKR